MTDVNLLLKLRDAVKEFLSCDEYTLEYHEAYKKLREIYEQMED
jgi:hypothetical protein